MKQLRRISLVAVAAIAAIALTAPAGASASSEWTWEGKPYEEQHDFDFEGEFYKWGEGSNIVQECTVEGTAYTAGPVGVLVFDAGGPCSWGGGYCSLGTEGVEGWAWLNVESGTIEVSDFELKLKGGNFHPCSQGGLYSSSPFTLTPDDSEHITSASTAPTGWWVSETSPTNSDADGKLELEFDTGGALGIG